MSFARKIALPLAVLVVAVAALAATGGSGRATSAGGCGDANRTGRFVATVSVEGVRRTALVNVPRSVRAGKRIPLVVALHGAGGNGRVMERYSGLTKVADARGYAIAYPDAEGKFWQLAPSGEQAHDDVTFIAALIDQLQRTTCIDPARVYATGVSNGGGLVARLGCELSDRFAAIAPVAGRYSVLPPCNPSQPVSVLEVHGTRDAAVSYSEVRPLLAQWRRLDGCSARVVRKRLAVRTLFTEWPACAGGSTVQHVELLGGPHAWPQTPTGGPGANSPYNAAAGVLGFFGSVPRRK